MRWLMRWLHALAGRDAGANRPSHPGRGVAKLAAMSRHRTRSNAFPTAVPILGGVSELARKYDGFVLDIWGVIHDGVRPYPGAVACLRRLKAGGKRVALLSNAPRRVAALVYQGSGLIARIKRELAAHLRADGFTAVAQAVGADHR